MKQVAIITDIHGNLLRPRRRGFAPTGGAVRQLRLGRPRTENRAPRSPCWSSTRADRFMLRSSASPMMRKRVKDLARNKIDAMRTDPSSHPFRLAKLLPELVREFSDRREPEVIRGCVDRILDDYDDVAVRSHILTLAHKQARGCLREETYAVLQTAQV